MKIAMVCALLLCLFIIFVGVAVWFSDLIWVAKFVASFLAVITGVAFGAIGIDLWRNE